MAEIEKEHHAVIIATTGRPAVLRQTIDSLSKQTSPPSQIIVVYAKEGDIDSNLSYREGLEVIRGRPGLTTQRNDGIDALEARVQLVTFIDDDIELSEHYLFNCREFFKGHPKVAAANGELLADGKITREDAKRLLCETKSSLPPISEHRPSRGLYGCNMTFRRKVLEKERFDERLRLWAYLEDFDIGIRSRRHGETVAIPACVAVHLAEPSGRISYRRRGFSQIMNSAYLVRKGVIPRREFWRVHIFMSMIRSNLIGTLVKSDHRARWEGFIGNTIAMSLILRNRIEPELAEQIK